MPTLDKHDLLLVCLALVFLGLVAASVAAGMRARSAAAAVRAALTMLSLLAVVAVLGLLLPASLSAALLIAFAVITWGSRWPYLVGKTRLGKVLITIPDQIGPRFTVPAGVLMAAVGLLWMAARPVGPRLAILPYLGLSMISLGIVEGLNFLFPTQIGSRGILDTYGGLCDWDNIESYSWSDDGELLQLSLRQSLISRRRILAVPPRFRADVAAYLSHRLWSAEVPPAAQEVSTDS